MLYVYIFSLITVLVYLCLLGSDIAKACEKLGNLSTKKVMVVLTTLAFVPVVNVIMVTALMILVVFKLVNRYFGNPYDI